MLEYDLKCVRCEEMCACHTSYGVCAVLSACV